MTLSEGSKAGGVMDEVPSTHSVPEPQRSGGAAGRGLWLGSCRGVWGRGDTVSRQVQLCVGATPLSSGSGLARSASQP